MRYPVALVLPVSFLLLTGCVSERHFARDSVWPFGNPNAPENRSETAQRALGQAPDVTPIPPQAGNVWPGAVQPVPTISDIEKNMNAPLGQAYTPSLPSPYPPGQQPPDTDSDDNPNYTVPPNGITPGPSTPSATAPGAGAPAYVPPITVPPVTPAPGLSAPGTGLPDAPLPLPPGNPHARE